MEYAKDEVFSIQYNKKKDRLEYPFFKRITKRILNNRFLTLLISMGVLFSIINFTLIYFFFQTLNSITIKWRNCYGSSFR